jgi:MerR family mercuric resistance operon transcriptional regulator
VDAGVQQMTIGGLTAAAGVNVETVRYYQRRGLLAEPHKPPGSVRRYGQTDVARVGFVKAAQRLGFSLEEVAALLSLDDGTHCREARELGRHKLDEVRAKLGDLRKIEAVLARLVRDCGGRRGTVSCPLIAALQQR